jgi:dienelactone hydrolase
MVLAIAMLLGPTPARAEASVAIPSSASAGLALRGELFRPSGGGKAPAVVLMHGCGGWQPAVLRGLQDHARFLARQGFVVLNLDSFGPRGQTGGRVCESTRRLAEARDFRTHDAFDALRFLRQQPFVDGARVFLVGQSNGGSTAMIAAMERTRARHVGTAPGFRGVVALYPWCGAMGTRRPELGSPLLILGGALDDWVPPDDCRRMQGRSRELRTEVYANAAHSFDVPIPVHRYLGNLIGYNPAATASARAEMLRFFRTYL